MAVNPCVITIVPFICATMIGIIWVLSGDSLHDSLKIVLTILTILFWFFVTMVILVQFENKRSRRGQQSCVSSRTRYSDTLVLFKYFPHLFCQPRSTGWLAVGFDKDTKYSLILFYAVLGHLGMWSCCAQTPTMVPQASYTGYTQ